MQNAFIKTMASFGYFLQFFLQQIVTFLNEELATLASRQFKKKFILPLFVVM